MSRPFANLDGLLRLSHTEGVDIRRPLVRVLTDLYVQEKSHTREEEQQYIELVLRLLPGVDEATRAAVARKLAPYPLTPAPIIAALTHDAPALAEYFSSVATANVEPIASPESSPPAPIVDGPDEIAQAQLTPADFRRVTAAIEDVESLGESFLAANTSERLAMLEALDRRGTHEEPALELPERTGASQRLDRSAMQRNQQEFARELQASLEISPRIAMRIVQDETGEALPVALKALGIRMSLFVRIILFLNPRIGESVERVFALARLYEELTFGAAVPIVASWRNASAAQTGARFQPMHASDATDAASARDLARSPGENYRKDAALPAPSPQRRIQRNT